MAEASEQKHESALGAIIGWGGLGLFALGFGWYVGAPLIIGERWANKKEDAIAVVKNYKPTGSDTLYDMIRSYSLQAKEKDFFVGEFKWDALQREGPEYEVTLLWTEGQQKHVAVWRVNLQDKGPPRPLGDAAANLPKRVQSGPPAKAG